MFNINSSMSNSFFNKFKKEEKSLVIEEEPQIMEDRTFWLSILQKIAFPVLNNLSKGTLRKNMPFESKTPETEKFNYLQGFVRVFNGIAPWLELGDEDSSEGKIRDKFHKLTLKCINNAVNTNSNDYIFVVEPKQSLVEIALFAQGLLRSKTQVWLNLPMDIQARIIRELKNTRIIAPYENHWLLYTSMIEAALLEFTGECDGERLSYAISKFRDDFYIGDSIYADGDDFESSYFNSIIIHPMLNDILTVMRKYGLSDGEFLDVQLMRSSRLSSQLERTISPEGTYPLLGKYLSYRCGVFQLLSQAALLKILPRNILPAQVRCALTKVLQRQFEGNQNFDSNGWLVCGLNAPQIDMCEADINTGSLYSCCSVFLALGLRSDDLFWTSPAEEWSSLKAWNGHQIVKDQSINF